MKGEEQKGRILRNGHFTKSQGEKKEPATSVPGEKNSRHREQQGQRF